MPLIALCANISWEFLYAFIFTTDSIQRVVNCVWFALDVIICIQLLFFGANEFPKLPRWGFFALFLCALLTSFGVVLFAELDFHDHGAFSAFGQNLMMSVLFIAMLSARRSLQGQSFAIALCKLIGTLFASLAFYFYARDSYLLHFLYLAILLYDLAYIVQIYRFWRSSLASLEHDQTRVPFPLF